MRKTSLAKYSFIYAKNYILESLGVRFPPIVPKPLYVGLSVGTVCNFKCKQCDLWQVKTDTEKYLSTKEIKKMLADLRNWLGPFRLVFTGAEPLVRKDMVEILHFAAQNDIYTVATSNGWLIDKKLAQTLVQSGLDVLNISLDGADARTHDSLRGKRGAFKKAVRGIKALRVARGDSSQPAIYINTVVMESNLAQLEKLVELVGKLKIDHIRFQALESKWLFGKEKYDPLWFKKDSLWPKDKEKVNKAFEQLKKLKAQGELIKNSYRELVELQSYYLDPKKIIEKYRFCYTGVRNFSIDEYGKVKLCFGMEPAGDLKKNSSEQIWYGKKAEKLRRVIGNCGRYCRILPCNKREEPRQLVRAFFNRLNNQ